MACTHVSVCLPFTNVGNCPRSVWDWILPIRSNPPPCTSLSRPVVSWLVPGMDTSHNTCSDHKWRPRTRTLPVIPVLLKRYQALAVICSSRVLFTCTNDIQCALLVVTRILWNTTNLFLPRTLETFQSLEQPLGTQSTHPIWRATSCCSMPENRPVRPYHLLLPTQNGAIHEVFGEATKPLRMKTWTGEGAVEAAPKNGEEKLGPRKYTNVTFLYVM